MAPSRLACIVAVLVSCRSERGAPPSPPPPDPAAVPATPVVKPTADEAMAAYDADDWPRCAETWLAIAARARGDEYRFALQSAACCFARGGKPDDAFAA